MQFDTWQHSGFIDTHNSFLTHNKICCLGISTCRFFHHVVSTIYIKKIIKFGLFTVEDNLMVGDVSLWVVSPCLDHGVYIFAAWSSHVDSTSRLQPITSVVQSTGHHWPIQSFRIKVCAGACWASLLPPHLPVLTVLASEWAVKVAITAIGFSRVSRSMSFWKGRSN